MTPSHIETSVNEINAFISKHNWMDFEIKSYDGYQLIIAGSTDLMYYHLIEITFEDVFWFSGFMNGWRSDTSKVILKRSDDYRKFEIEQGYELVEFDCEDYQNNVFVAAKTIHFNTEIKKLYDSENP
ncbi:hypothetical protein HXZ94_07435 [Empedobacter falsenii]|uniref:hypothetical protein n=1 Tax=Empedobacter falsenii TaxID=343874 RepID=UPI002575CFC3|nr:hypothetical protein [Empedobacter falsenii]MDM1298333.1 hypothetical protein [Empedobacter falsenii]MDM1318110.1 hypothetical protein [Empedobacter falsenii]